VIEGGISPYWSPDGSQIAYTVPCDVNPDGYWCPEGSIRRSEYDPQTGDLPAGLAIADADGSNIRAFGFAASGPWHPGAATPEGTLTARGRPPYPTGPPPRLGDEVEELSLVKTHTAEEATGGRPRLEELYVRNAPAALRTAYFLTGNADLAEDLVQEAFVRIAGRFGHLRVPDAFPAYLHRTVVNLFTSQLRRRALEREWTRRQPGEIAIFQGGPEEHDDLWRALAVLPPRQRAAIVLRYYEDLSERDAAAILRCSTGALHQLVVRGTATLREQLAGVDR
jgi:RNA polymerase sigma-70 factor (sigma-E family)